MKNSIGPNIPGFYFVIFFFIMMQTLQGQKNTVIVRDAKGTGIEGVTVYLFDKKEGRTCVCFDGGCLMSPPAYDINTTGNSGHAKFGQKGDPVIKPNTTYYASIDAKCSKTQDQQQPCNNQTNLCKFEASYKEAKTDDKGKFDAVIFTK